MQSRRIFSVLVVLLFTSSCYAQLTIEEADGVIQDFRSKLIQKVNSKDASGIAALFDSEAIVVLGNARYLRTREKIKEFMQAPYLNEDVQISGFVINELNIDKPAIILDDNAFIATGTAQYQILFNKSKNITLPNRWVMVLHRIEGQWHIASYQGTVNVFDNSYIDDMRYIFYLISLITFLLGIITAVSWRRLKKSKLL